jgi:hypothetical protein
MKFLFSILFILGICCSQNSFAQTSCTLPAPSNLQVLNQTPTYLLVGWDAVPGAIGYEIECKNANNVIIPVQSFSTPTSASFIIEPNMDYTVTARSICSNGEVGGEVCSIFVPEYVLIVVDLLPGYQSDVNISPVSAFEKVHPEHDVEYITPITPDGRYYYQFETNGSLVKGIIHEGVIRGNKTHVDWGRIAESALPWNLVGIIPDLDSDGFLTISHQMGPKLSENPNNAVYFSFEDGQLSVRVFHRAANIISITNLFIYPVVSPKPSGEGERSNSDTFIEDASVIIAPNPFSDHLNVLLPQTPESQVTVKIFDITGKLQQTTSLQPSDITYRAFEVNTNELRPGIYIMQIDNGSKEITTHKVVKI